MDGRLDGGDGPGPIGVRPANLAARRIRTILRIRHLGDNVPFRLAADKGARDKQDIRYEGPLPKTPIMYIMSGKDDTQAGSSPAGNGTLSP